MRMPVTLSATALVALLAACGSEQPATDTAATPAAEATVAEAAPATGGPASYLGQNAGDGFLADPAVVGAIDKAVTDQETRMAIQQMGGPTMQVMDVDGKIAASQCENGNCSDHNYAVYIDPETETGDVCYYDTADNVQANWFMADGTTERRDGGCTVG